MVAIPQEVSKEWAKGCFLDERGAAVCRLV